jgi:uracil-DNA glycosylase family 4
VAWREHVAREKRAAFRDWEYWGKPVPGWGDPHARIFIVGLAPAAHGGNRTGRIFTGDRSGDWLFASLYRTGFANQPTSTHRDDGLALGDVYIAAAVRCAPPENKPTPAETAACHPFLAREAALLPGARVIVALGAFAYAAAARLTGLRPRPAFGHGVEVLAPTGHTIVCSYHPSQRNTFTGRLTPEMFDGIFLRARELADEKDGDA